MRAKNMNGTMGRMKSMKNLKLNTMISQVSVQMKKEDTDKPTVSPEKSLEFRKKMCDGKGFYQDVKKELFTSIRELQNSRLGTTVGKDYIINLDPSQCTNVTRKMINHDNEF